MKSRTSADMCVQVASTRSSVVKANSEPCTNPLYLNTWREKTGQVGAMTQLVMCLPCKPEVLSSVPTTT